MIKKKTSYIFSGRAADYETLLTHLKINLAKVEGIDSANNWLLQGGWEQEEWQIIPNHSIPPSLDLVENDQVTDIDRSQRAERIKRIRDNNDRIKKVEKGVFKAIQKVIKYRTTSLLSRKLLWRPCTRLAIHNGELRT